MTVMVKVLQQMSGLRNGQPWPAVGELMEMSEDEAYNASLGQTPMVEVLADEPAPPSEPKAPKAPRAARTTAASK